MPELALALASYTTLRDTTPSRRSSDQDRIVTEPSDDLLC